MQIHARRQQARMPRRGLNLGQRSAAGERMADERVPPVVDRQRAQPIPAEYATRRVEAAPRDVAVEGFS